MGLVEKFMARIRDAETPEMLGGVLEDLDKARGLSDFEIRAIQDSIERRKEEMEGLDQVIDAEGAGVAEELRQEAQEAAAVELVSLESRGTEARIQEFLGSRRLDAIIEASTDGLGEGILYHNLGREGLWPSADLVDMITADMGGIQENIVKVEKLRLPGPDGKESWDIYEATVEAIDTRTGKRVVSEATEVIDWAELRRTDKKGKPTPRTFAKRKAIRKAARNAKLGLIPVPRKALCTLIKRVLVEYKEKRSPTSSAAGR